MSQESPCEKGIQSNSPRCARSCTPITQATETTPQSGRKPYHRTASVLSNASTQVKHIKKSLSHIAYDLKVRTYQLDEKKMFDSACCDNHTDECLKRSFGPFIKNFVRGFVVRLLLTVAQSRKSKKVIAALKGDIPKFGVVLGVTAALYHLTICLMKRLKKLCQGKFSEALSEKTMCMIAALVSGLFLSSQLQNGEKNLMKLLFYPLAFRCLCDKILDVGLVSQVKHGDILVYMIFGFFCAFSTLIEWNSCPDGLRQTIQHSFTRMTYFECRSFSVANMAFRKDKALKYKFRY